MQSKILNELIDEIRKRGAYEVSKKSGIPKSTIESWIYGKAIPSLTKAEQVADAMDLEILLFDKE